jgi:STAS domain
VVGFGERVWVVESGVDAARIAGHCERFAAFAATGTDREVIVCDVGAIIHPDLAALSLLARLQLIARRHGRGIQLYRAQHRLIELILFAGLGGVLPLYRGLALELHGQAEQGEEPLDIEEVVDPLDPPA